MRIKDEDWNRRREHVDQNFLEAPGPHVLDNHEVRRLKNAQALQAAGKMSVGVGHGDRGIQLELDLLAASRKTNGRMRPLREKK